MTLFDLENELEGLDEVGLAGLEGETDVSGPWNSSYIFRLNLKIDGKQIGVIGSLSMDDDTGCCEDIERITAYDLEGFDEDADPEEGEEFPEDHEIYEKVYDAIAELL